MPQVVFFTYQLMEGDVVFDHVDFGYTEDKEVLHDIEIYARPGQKVAFVGATGAGKTIVLFRFLIQQPEYPLCACSRHDDGI